MTDFVKTLGQKLPALGRHPAFYLIYLVFFFFPWLRGLPEPKELALSALIIAIFIPVHFRSFHVSGQRNLTFITITQLLTIVAAPLTGMNGVFHIYASAQAGYQKDHAFSAAIFLVLTVIYAAVSYYFDRHIFEIFFACFMAGIIWITCLQDANQMADAKARERSLELEKQQASIIERERIARDLHDLLGHTLTMVSLKSDLAYKLIDKDPDAARDEIDDIRTSTREALSDIREVLGGMNKTTVAEELSNAEKSLQTAEIAFNVIGDIPAFKPGQEQVVAMAIRETVTNTIRHSDATKVTFSFSESSDETLITIEDNGTIAGEKPGRGLLGLKDRVRQIGGSTRIDFSQGALIALTLPHMGTSE